MEKDPRINVWITKYALTDGVIFTEAEHCISINTDMILVMDGTFKGCCFHEKDWHTSEGSARERVFEMIKIRRKSLQKSLGSLSKLEIDLKMGVLPMSKRTQPEGGK